ncbi:CapA family protein [Geodermatophilus ruber]|uniref:Poly-gamma-glutamate synthesis protein (Capsule biosynthesis protein) n=1 Tax=Geodermatophilus ruber TaxID=504800 RepID=A0A1I4DTX8_9ACTN|nr:CapA family protein [Geodermatophilus ruber]SFK96513.1 poly-gamma-glutamate synthesis protein (capsule biosynthesis protein) [Geodermatophilus ruber]
MAAGPVTLFLCGDVMLGRGVDQVLPHPGDPRLHERSVRDARAYVRLAEEVHGPVPRPVAPSWPWGEALRVLDAAAPDVRIVNLETSVTRSDDFAPGKAVHYRMHPANLAALTVARPDACVLANNHVLDLGVRGLLETLEVLEGAGLRGPGAGRDAAAAERPVVLPAGGNRRVLLVAAGSPSSGIPPHWAAGPHRPGVAYLPALTDAAADALAERVRGLRRPGDVVVASLHWGSNWGWPVPEEQVRFAHRLVDGGVDVVHGHSSHHPRPIEVYRDRLVLYGCGDLVDDYEGIGGREQYRDDLRLAWFVTVDADSGCLAGLRMVPLQARRLRLEPAAAEDVGWLAATLTRISAGSASAIEPAADGSLVLLAR